MADRSQGSLWPALNRAVPPLCIPGDPCYEPAALDRERETCGRWRV